MTSVRTNLGPLTTPFTYPASCSVVVKQCSTCDFGWQAQTCSDNNFNAQGVQDNLECWPPRSNDNLSSGVALGGWGFYSPGLECPVGYATACATTPGVEGGFEFQFSVLAKETVVGCCPSGYSCAYDPGSGHAQTCYKYIRTGSFPTVQCASGSSNKFSYVTVPQTVTATPKNTVTGAVVSPTVVAISQILVYAPLIQLNFQSTDIRSSTTSSTSASTGSGISTSTPTSTSTVNPDPGAARSSSGGLATGAQAGIGVACGIIGLLLIGALVWWLRKRSQRRKVMPTLPPPHPFDETKYVAEAPTERDAHEVEANKPGTYAAQQQQYMQPQRYGQQPGVQYNPQYGQYPPVREGQAAPQPQYTTPPPGHGQVPPSEMAG